MYVVFLRGAASVPSLLGEKEGEEIEERCNPSAATDDKLFARGSNAFMGGSTGEQQKRCLAFTQLITQLISSFLSRTRGGAASHSREQIALPPLPATLRGL
jgi:hypothetical protein